MADRRRGLSVRTSATLAAAVVVGIVLLVGVLFGQAYLRDSLEAETQTTAQSRADALAAQLEAGGHLLTLVGSDEEDELVQVVDADGTAVGYSPTARGLPVLTDVGSDRVAVDSVDDDDEAERTTFVLATAQMSADAEAEDMAGGTVVVGKSLTNADNVAIALTVVLVVAAAGLMLLIALTTWLLVGRALRPVERMREQADAISHANLGLRLPEPTGDDEVARLARTLNAMLVRLERAAAAQRRFVSDASHELRTPLTVIRQNAELVISYPEQVDAAGLARDSLVEAERMQDLVDGLLVLARSDERRLRPADAAVDLDDLLLVEAGRVRAAGTAQVDTSGVGAAQVPGDQGLLARVLRNLVDNAVRHASGTVRLACSTGNGWAVVDVDDDGPGVPPADRLRVFDRFVRLDDARARDVGGSGLGLAIVREAVGAHGGDVQVLDAPSGGARFRVRLPERRG